VQFDLNIQTSVAFAAGGSTPLFFYTGQGYTTNSNADQSAAEYRGLGFYFPSAGSNEFGIKIGSTSVGGPFIGTQKVTWVINRTANPVGYTGPGGTVSTVDATSFEVWVGTTKLDLTAVTIPGPANSGANSLTDFRIRTAATWVGHAAFKNVKIGYLGTGGTSSTEDAANYSFSQSFDNAISATAADYKLSANTGNVPVGTTGGPIADNARFTVLPNAVAQSNPNFYYAVDADGFKINRANQDVKQGPQINDLAIPDDAVAFIQFDLKVKANAYTAFTPLTFQVGDNFTNTSNDPTAANVYHSLGIKFPSNDNFNISGTTGTPAYSGTQRITWVINRSAGPVNYTGLDASTHSVAAGSYDVWVGTNKLAFDTAPSTSSTVQIKDFRIRCAAPWTGTLPNIAIKNLVIGYIPTDGTGQVLPIKLTSFTAKTNTSAINLNWQTSSESNFSHFDVTRSVDGRNFTKIGERAAKGPSIYSFTDFSPAKGNNYYQLIAQDKDGKSEKSEIVSAKIATPSLAVNIENTAAQTVGLNIYSEKADNAKITLSNLNGQVITSINTALGKGYSKISLPTGNYTGLIIATVTSSDTIISKKTVK